MNRRLVSPVAGALADNIKPHRGNLLRRNIGRKTCEVCALGIAQGQHHKKIQDKTRKVRTTMSIAKALARAEQVGKNVEYTVEGNILTMRIDLSKDFGPSASGKTRIIASTCGNAALPGGAKVGVNVYR